MAQSVNITISDKTGTRSSTPTPQTSASATGNAAPLTSEGIANTKQVKSIAIATMISQKAFSYTTSNVGKWAGDSHVQARVNAVQEAVGIGAMAYINPALAGINVALNVATTALDYGFENSWEKKRSRQELARLGYSSKDELLGRKR